VAATLAVRRPVRMNEADVTFRLLQRGATTPKDRDYREAVSYRNYNPEVTVKGQLVGARAFWKLQRSQTGDVNPSTGAIVFRPDVLQKVGVTLNKGDQIVKIAGKDVDFQVEKVSPLTPYRGGLILTHVEFSERRKVYGSV